MAWLSNDTWVSLPKRFSESMSLSGQRLDEDEDKTKRHDSLSRSRARHNKFEKVSLVYAFGIPRPYSDSIIPDMDDPIWGAIREEAAKRERMEDLKKRKLKDVRNGVVSSEAKLRLLHDPLSKSQLVNVLVKVRSRYPSIAEEIKSVATADAGFYWTEIMMGKAKKEAVSTVECGETEGS